jgi:hypothetical protein
MVDVSFVVRDRLQLGVCYFQNDFLGFSYNMVDDVL